MYDIAPNELPGGRIRPRLVSQQNGMGSPIEIYWSDEWHFDTSSVGSEAREAGT